MSSKTKVIAAIAGLLVIGGAVALFAYNAAQPAAEVDVATAVTADLAVTVTASGRVEPDVRGDVFPPTAGELATVNVVDGQMVRAGTVLAVLDTGPLDVAVAQARAALAQAEAALAQVDNEAPGNAELAAARRATDAAWAAYCAAQESAASVGNQAPTDADIRAAASATQAAKNAYERAADAFAAVNRVFELNPTPSAETTLSAASAVLDQAEAAYLGAQAAERSLRSVDLSAQQATADAGVVQAHAAYLAAKAQQEQLEHLDLSPQRAAARAGVEQAREALALAQESRAGAELKAPVDGTVLFNPIGTPSADGALPLAAVGAIVGPQAAPFTVVQLEAVRFAADVDEVDIALVETDMVARVRLDAMPERSFETTVSEIRPSATLTPTGGTVFPVYLRIRDVDVPVLLGMRGDATIEVSRVEDAVTVPIEALFDDAQGSYVFLIDDDDRLVRRTIEVGALTESTVEVRSGVRSGDRVALAGAEELSDGMHVRAR